MRSLVLQNAAIYAVDSSEPHSAGCSSACRTLAGLRMVVCWHNAPHALVTLPIAPELGDG